MINPANSELKQFLENAIANSPFSIDEISIRAGYPNPAIVRMVLDGMSKIPINQVRRLAEAIGCPTEDLMFLVLEATFGPDVLADIELGFNCDRNRSTTAALLRTIKTTAGGTMPELTSNVRRRIKLAFSNIETMPDVKGLADAPVP